MINAAGFDASWYDSADTGSGTFKVARITMSTDAELGGLPWDLSSVPIGRSYDKETAGVGVPFYSPNWPEPATLAMMSLGGVALLRRRRE